MPARWTPRKWDGEGWMGRLAGVELRYRDYSCILGCGLGALVPRSIAFNAVSEGG